MSTKGRKRPASKRCGDSIQPVSGKRAKNTVQNTANEHSTDNITGDTNNYQETITQESTVSQLDPVISNMSKQRPTGKQKRSKESARLHVKQRKGTHKVTIPVGAVPAIPESSGSYINNDTRQTARNESGDRHPVRNNLQVPGSSLDVQGRLSDSTDSSDGPSASEDEETVLNTLGANHVQALNNLSAEGINPINPSFRYEEPISTSISSQIPHKIKKKIWLNQFIDLAVLLPNSYTANANSNFHLEMSPNSKISLVPNQTKRIFNIDMWTTAFLRFMAIYTEQFSFEAPQLLKYAEIVRDLARRTQNLSWYTYDQQFRTLCETVQIPWGRIHTEFWIMASHSQPQRYFRPTFRTSRYNRNQAYPRNRKYIENTCWSYNRRGFCGERTCRFLHKCGACKGNHPASNCTTQPRTLQNTGGFHAGHKQTPAPSGTTIYRSNNSITGSVPRTT